MDKSGFTRRLHALLVFFALVGDLFKHLHTEARYVLDSFPVAICQIRAFYAVSY